MALYRKSHQNLSATDAKKRRDAFMVEFAKTSFVAAPPDLAKLKNYPHVNMTVRPPTIDLQNSDGHWTGINGTYIVSIQVDGRDQQLSGEIHGDRLALSNAEVGLGFVRAD
jgi:hypothetical protein